MVFLLGKSGNLFQPGNMMRRLFQEEADRHFLWAPVLIAAGVIIYFTLQSEPGWMAAFASASGAALLAAILVWRKRAGLAFVVALVAFGFVLGKVRTESLMTPVLHKDSRVVTVSGWVESVEFKSANRQRAVIRVTALEPLPPELTGLAGKLRISFSRRDGDLHPGRLITFRARLFKPRRPVAPGAFDFARRDWFRGIGGSGFAFGDVAVSDEPADRPFDLAIGDYVAGLRNAIASAVRTHLDGDVAAFAVAVLTGMRGELPEASVANLRAAGLAHLLAISGLHMGLVAITIFGLMRSVLALSSHAALRWPIKKWSALAALLGGAVYLALSGGAVSTQRAYVMIAIMFLAVIVERPAISMRNVALAALLILLLRPESVLNVSFQMSFLAVIGLVALYEMRGASKPRWITLQASDGWPWRTAKRSVLYIGGVVFTTLVASLATAPVAAYHFNRVAVLGVVANLVAIPLMGIVIMPMALVGVLLIPFGLEGVPFTVAGWGISLVLEAAEATAALSGAMRHVSAMPPEALLLFVFGGLWICLWQRPWRWAGSCLLVLGVVVSALTERPDVLVEQEAKNIAVRVQGGQLALSSSTSARFAAERWLAADGDGAALSEASLRAGITCDEEGCIALGRGGMRIAFLNSPSALRDECDTADIVVTAFSFRGSCGGARFVVDRFALYRYGAHALYFKVGDAKAPEIRVERVADRRGNRPWTEAAGDQ